MTNSVIRGRRVGLSRARGLRVAADSVVHFPISTFFLILLQLAPYALAAQIDVSRRLVVRSVTFEGNQALDNTTLRTSIYTSQSTLFARSPLLRWIGLGEKRFFNERQFRRDVLRLETLYRRSGFPQVRVDTVVTRTPDAVAIRFVVTEGDPIVVRDVSITGTETIAPTDALMRDLPLRVGRPLDELMVQASAALIRSNLRDRGHPFPTVFQTVEADDTARVARVWFNVVAGPRVVIGRIDVEGADHIEESVIRRAIDIRSGQPFSEQALYESQLSLYRLNVFNYVDIALTDSLSSEARDTTLPIRVRVTEGSLHRVRLGGGYGTMDCLRTSAAWSGYNFMGGGRALQLEGRLSQLGTGSPTDAGLEHSLCPALAEEDTSRLKLNFGVSASVHQPYVFSRHTSAVFSVFAEQQTEFQAYLRRAVGGDVSVIRSTRWDVPITASYSASYGTTKADPATFCALLNVCRATDTEVFGQGRLRSTLSLALVRDRANSPLNPTAGTVLALDIRWASEVLGSDSLARFLKGVAEFTAYHPLGRRTVAAWRIRLGGARVPTIGFSGGAERFLTPEERFFGGGPNSVRGFTQNELGPRVYVLDVPGADPDTAARASPTGGVAVALLNAELRFPLTRRGEHFFGALFVDAGQVANRFRDAIDPADLRVTPGLGFRVTSPLGPIRLDMAYNPYEATPGPLYENRGTELVLVEEEYQPPARSFLERWRVHFSVGQAF